MEGDAAASTLSLSLSRAPPSARSARTVIQRYRQIAKSQRQTASKCAKRTRRRPRDTLRCLAFVILLGPAEGRGEEVGFETGCAR